MRWRELSVGYKPQRIALTICCLLIHEIQVTSTIVCIGGRPLGVVTDFSLDMSPYADELSKVIHKFINPFVYLRVVCAGL